MAENIDSLLIRYYSVKSPEEISVITGIPAMEIAKRTEEALGRRDYLGEAAKVQTILARMEAAAAELESRLPDASDRNASAIGNSIGGLLGRALGELRKVRQETRIDLDAVHSRYADEMVRIVEASYNRQLGKLAERYPDVPQEDLEAEFHELVLTVSREADSE